MVFMQESLMALSGITGEVFVLPPLYSFPPRPPSFLRPTGSTNESHFLAEPLVSRKRRAFLIPTDYPFLHPGERSVLEDSVGFLGLQYLEVVTMLEWITDSSAFAAKYVDWADASGNVNLEVAGSILNNLPIDAQPDSVNAAVATSSLSGAIPGAGADVLTGLPSAGWSPGDGVGPGSYTSASSSLPNPFQTPSSPLYPPRSVYINALARAAETAVLKPYRALIVETEQRLLSQFEANSENARLNTTGGVASTSVTYFRSAFAKYLIVLPSLHSFLLYLLYPPPDSPYPAPPLLTLLYERSLSGDPDIRDCFEQITALVEHGVLLAQCFVWCSYGRVWDPSKEWWIRRKGEDRVTESALAQVGASRVTDRTRTTFADYFPPQSETPVDPSEFVVSSQFIPSYVPRKLSEEVLFIGQATSMIRRVAGTERRAAIEARVLLSEHEANVKTAFATVSPLYSASDASGTAKLDFLPSSPSSSLPRFPTTSLLTHLHPIANRLSSALHHFLLSRSLARLLRSVREIALIGRGDVWEAWSEGWKVAGRRSAIGAGGIAGLAMGGSWSGVAVNNRVLEHDLTMLLHSTYRSLTPEDDDAGPHGLGLDTGNEADDGVEWVSDEDELHKPNDVVTPQAPNRTAIPPQPPAPRHRVRTPRTAPPYPISAFRFRVRERVIDEDEYLTLEDPSAPGTVVAESEGPKTVQSDPSPATSPEPLAMPDGEKSGVKGKSSAQSPIRDKGKRPVKKYSVPKQYAGVKARIDLGKGKEKETAAKVKDPGRKDEQRDSSTNPDRSSVPEMEIPKLPSKPKRPPVRKSGKPGDPYASELVGLPVTLECDAEWPLDAVVGGESWEGYSALYSFLLTIKRIQLRLDRDVWVLVVKARNLRHSVNGVPAVAAAPEVEDLIERLKLDLGRRVWSLRAAMSFFVGALWAYLQSDILEPNFQNLLRSLKSRRTLSSQTGQSPTITHLSEVHSRFLKGIMKGCFLEQNVYAMVGTTIKAVLETCGRFASSVEKGWDNILPTVPDSIESAVAAGRRKNRDTEALSRMEKELHEFEEVG
ncbi:hypothetical protein HDU93_007286 [Gonapodya sp. JEL0774]|nr:hypothetical protein HDU93_007286 [Gonapodya sp. JEL0774]